MKYRLLLVWASIVGVTLTGCTYAYEEAEPAISSTVKTTQSKEPSVNKQALPCRFDVSLSAHSPGCPPYTMMYGQPVRIDGMPESGACSIEEAKKAPMIVMDFRRYIGNDTFATPTWRALIGNGTTVALPTWVFDLIKILSPEIPNDDRQVYPISQSTYESLIASIPSLGGRMANIGLTTETHYLASHRCLPIAPNPY